MEKAGLLEHLSMNTPGYFLNILSVMTTMPCSDTLCRLNLSPFEYLLYSRPFLEGEGVAIVLDSWDSWFWLLERTYTGYFPFVPQVHSPHGTEPQEAVPPGQESR